MSWRKAEKSGKQCPVCFLVTYEVDYVTKQRQLYCKIDRWEGYDIKHKFCSSVCAQKAKEV